MNIFHKNIILIKKEIFFIFERNYKKYERIK